MRVSLPTPSWTSKQNCPPAVANGINIVANAGSWSQPTLSEWKTLNRAYMVPIRCIASMENRHNNKHYTEAQVLLATAKPVVAIQVKAAAIRTLCRLVKVGPAPLWRIMLLQHRQPGSWMNNVTNSLQECWSVSRSLRPRMVSPCASMRAYSTRSSCVSTKGVIWTS